MFGPVSGVYSGPHAPQLEIATLTKPQASQPVLQARAGLLDSFWATDAQLAGRLGGITSRETCECWCQLGTGSEKKYSMCTEPTVKELQIITLLH